MRRHPACRRDAALGSPRQPGDPGGAVVVERHVHPAKGCITVEKTRLGSADIDDDGRDDWVMFTARGSGTRIRILKARYDKVVPGPDWKVYIPWNEVRPL